MHAGEVLKIFHSGVVEGAPRVHALDDGCHVAEDHSVHQGWRCEQVRNISAFPLLSFIIPGEFPCIASQLTTHEHDADGEDFLCIRVGTYVAETDTGEAAEREVEGGDVGTGDGGAAHGAVDVRGV